MINSFVSIFTGWVLVTPPLASSSPLPQPLHPLLYPIGLYYKPVQGNHNHKANSLFLNPTSYTVFPNQFKPTFHLPFTMHTSALLSLCSLPQIHWQSSVLWSWPSHFPSVVVLRFLVSPSFLLWFCFVFISFHQSFTVVLAILHLWPRPTLSTSLRSFTAWLLLNFSLHLYSLHSQPV